VKDPWLVKITRGQEHEEHLKDHQRDNQSVRIAEQLRGGRGENKPFTTRERK